MKINTNFNNILIMKIRVLNIILVYIILILIISNCTYRLQESIYDFNQPSGLVMLEDFVGQPDSLGIVKEEALSFPDFSQGAYFAADGSGPGYLAGNRNHMWLFDQNYEVTNELNFGENAPYYLLKYPAGKEGSFTILKLMDGDYLCLLPLVGEKSMSWIKYEKGQSPMLQVSSLGSAPIEADVPLLAWGRSKNLYEASYLVWKRIMESDLAAVNTTWRSDKNYPEPFSYLGWCTWEEFKRDINDSLLISSVQKIKESPVPVRFALIDDGHEWTAPDTEKLISFEPDPQKFSQGWSPIADLKSESDIRWLGLWHHQSGYFQGLAEENKFGDLNQHLTKLAGGLYLPKPDSAAIEFFYQQLFTSSKNAGFDFNKIDFQTTNLGHYAGEANAVQAHHKVTQSMEEITHQQGLDLLNCIAQDMVSVFNTQYSSVTRCSQDYRKGNISNARIHIYQSYNNLLWMGHTVFGDHDMFHSSDTVCGRLMAVSKAISGGPVYLSDHPDDFIGDHIMPLCYQDGEIIRPLAPALPLPVSVFSNPYKNKAPYSVIAPMPNHAASIVSYNLYESEQPVKISASIAREDYQHASALLQPYVGKWKLPAEGLVMYDWYAQKVITEAEFNFELNGFSDKLIHLLPLQNGLAVIGRLDKYLSPATVSEISINEDNFSFSLAESGPFAIYLESGTPRSEMLNFEARQNGLWVANMPVGEHSVTVDISVIR
jgi:hypothetical protein